VVADAITLYRALGGGWAAADQVAHCPPTAEAPLPEAQGTVAPTESALPAPRPVPENP
jgi:hypothetical protein